MLKNQIDYIFLNLLFCIYKYFFYRIQEHGTIDQLNFNFNLFLQNYF